ncbi:hypothetical protein [Guptibacillus algicola]|uniref:hypothetical protein n=1 Tax=Guptibacillus algicola TaxID=225844 RepID=UPI001CD4DAA0|nr:hypothetical protein [Alkalihalobacillus algicola]MCA0988609.1 hypothetical protein [Alkalihalobacillus algicola]
MINIAFGIALLIVCAIVQYSWFFDTNNGIAIDFKSKRSYILTSIALVVFAVYLLATGIANTF